MTVAQNISVLNVLEGQRPEQMERRVNELLELVHLEAAQFAERYPGELSGGQRQRVGIARALALDPEYLLMDEPFGALDPITRSQLLEDLQPLFKDLGKTVLLVTHDLEEAFAIGHRVTLLHQGSLVQTGPPDELMNAPANDFVAQFLRTIRRQS